MLLLHGVYIGTYIGWSGTRFENRGTHWKLYELLKAMTFCESLFQYPEMMEARGDGHSNHCHTVLELS